MRVPGLLLAVLLAAVTSRAPGVSVAYAGSLVRIMEGPAARAFAQQTHFTFAGEPGGSKALEHLIAAGLRTPDVFVSADPALLEQLRRTLPAMIDAYAAFGSARMVIAYSERSPHRAIFERAAAGKIPVLDALNAPGVRVGRTDPQLDPKGARTLRVLSLLGAQQHDDGAARRLLENSGVYPEEDLAVRVESGELDAGFFYSTEIQGRRLRVVELPPGTNLSGEIAYAIAVLSGARNPQGARAFVSFVLHGGGRSVLESAGIRYFARPRVVGRM
jgi:molybdate/tungstate transport system substrate-binding protein